MSIVKTETVDEQTIYWTLCFTNAMNTHKGPAAMICIRAPSNAVEAATAQGFQPIDGEIGTFELTPGSRATRPLLIPANAESLRVSFEYTGSRVISGRLALIAQHLPLAIRRRLNWRRIPFVHYGPANDWHKTTIDLPLRELGVNGRSHVD